MHSCRPLFTRVHSSRPLKNRRTFNALNRRGVRVLLADGPQNATSAAGSTAQAARSGLSAHIWYLSGASPPTQQRQLQHPLEIRTTATTQRAIVRLSHPGNTSLITTPGAPPSSHTHHTAPRLHQPQLQGTPTAPNATHPPARHRSVFPNPGQRETRSRSPSRHQLKTPLDGAD